MRIPLASSGLRDVDIEAATLVLKSGNLTMGSQVKNFEADMARYLGVEHFVMMNSGSSANLAMVEALLRPAKGNPKLVPGDKVLVPAIAWPTTIWPIVQLGLEPIFVDVNPKTLALDLENAQLVVDKIGPKVRGVFPIHPLGYAISPKELHEFVMNNNLILINDVCESLGSWREGKHAGTSGIAGSFSFYFSHHITTMEGGGVATNDSNFADDLRSIRSHGWSRDRSDVEDWRTGVSSNDAKFLFVSTGYNVRPMEIQAAIGISQIRDIDVFIDKRRAIASAVNAAIDGSCIELIGADNLNKGSDQRGHSWMLLPLRIKGPKAAEIKKAVVNALEILEIETRPVLTGNFLAQPAMKTIGLNSQKPQDFPVATVITETAFLVGAHHDLTLDQISFLCNALKNVAADFS
jgi:CDP-4-dehydro-6-deoxyglucose reductase, E1